MGNFETMEDSKIIENFENVKFNGTFRSYQQKVLDDIDELLADNKVHVVAAPGSGKTILGLEIIRRLNAPALIFSPTITIEHQWGERFAYNFIENPKDASKYVSYSLKDIKLLTSATYQSLHSAMNRLVDEEEDSEANDCQKVVIDYSNFDLIKAVREAGIKTICLDEAHHLRSEWQKSLEKFISLLSEEVKVVSLTATPPYDSTQGEWDKYISVCGEIDTEIFVPELIAENTLCPHQDFIYFNYPTADEAQVLQDFKQKAYNTVQEIIKGEDFTQIIKHIESTFQEQQENIYKYVYEYVAILSLANSVGIAPPKKLIKKITVSGKLTSRSGLTIYYR